MASAPSKPRKRGRDETDEQTPNKMARPGTVKKAELTRLLVDALQRLGHTNLAHQLEEESVRPLRGSCLSDPSCFTCRECRFTAQPQPRCGKEC